MRSAIASRAVRVLALVAVSLLTASVAGTAARQPSQLSLVSTAWSPFTNEPGQPRFALDLVEDALQRIGFSATTTIVPAPQFTSLLLAGRFDGSAAVWRDAERERALIFSQPYLENRLVLVGRRGADVSAKALSDIKQKRVAIVEGYSYGDAVNQTGPVFVRSQSEEDSLRRLLEGGVDYTLMDELVVHYIVSNYPKEAATRLQIGPTPMITRELHFAVARTRADAASIIERFNAQIRTMITDRTYHRLLQVDWIRADVDGDGLPEYVPIDDRAGPKEPQRIYSLFSGADKKAPSGLKPGFYMGGNIYADWASVPESYKESDPRFPDSRRSTASIFKFTW
jgi:ABC-type amino acid transport substrate-binding protein